MTAGASGGGALYPEVAAAVPEGLVWSYRIIVRGGRDSHTWTLIGDRGGIHVDAWESSSNFRDDRWMGGIEAHAPTGDGKPSHEHCWLIGKPCWHDGSSLQFSEQIAPYLPQPGAPFESRDHLDVLHVMVSRYNQWLPELPTPAKGCEV